jgi:hypothetical protein
MTQLECLDLHEMKPGQPLTGSGPAFFCVILYNEHYIEFQNVTLNLINQTIGFNNPAMKIIINEFPTNGGVGNSINMADGSALENICNRFGLTPNGLPYVIFFSDLNRGDFNQFCFRNADLKTVQNFFIHNLDNAAKFRYQQMNFIKLMMVTREMFPQLRTESDYVFENSLTALPQSTFNQKEKGYPELIVVNNVAYRNIRRHSAKCKEKCRELAKKIWAKNPAITIADMAVRDEISEMCKNKTGDLYAEKTIKNWIKVVSPNRKPGRRPKN